MPETRRTFLKWLMISAALGLLAPGCWFLAHALFGDDLPLLERVISVVWPTSIWLMATDGIEGTPTDYLFTLSSVAANVILYAVAGSAGWRLRRLWVR
jgi:hypothetical protein